MRVFLDIFGMGSLAWFRIAAYDIWSSRSEYTSGFERLLRPLPQRHRIMKKLLTILFAVALGLNLSAQEECMNPDVNCDGYVNVNDLLGLLGYFGDEDLDGDGIWDSQDDCVEDDCGICDGPGPEILEVDTIIVVLDSVYLQGLDDWYTYEFADTTFTLNCPCFWVCR